MILPEKYYVVSAEGLLEEVLLEQAIKDYPNTKTFDLVVPACVKTLRFLCLPTDYHKIVSSISLPDGITEIPQDFMNGGVQLTSVVLPPSLQKIGINAFYHCENLNSIHLPSGVVFIGKDAFGECRGLQSLVLPDSIKEIDICAFAKCTGLSSVILPAKVAIIGVHAFEGTVRDEMLQEYDGCLYLGSLDNPYYMLFKMKSTDRETYEIHPDTRIINADAFGWAKNLKKIVLPKRLLSIGRDAFWHCKRLTRISVPDSVQTVGIRAFGNSGLKKVSFGTKIKILPTDIFDCGIDEIYYRGSLKEFDGITKEYGWVPPWRVITITCRDETLIKDKRGTSWRKYRKHFDD